jgi:exopolysaccharide production protein ExoQ
LARLAFVLTVSFIIFALRFDLKESRQLSRSLWIPFLWLAVSASKPITLWLHPNLTAAAELSELDFTQGDSTERIFLLFLISAGLIVLYRNREKWAFHLKDNFSLYIFHLYALLSIIWSDYPGVSAKRWIRATGNIIMVLVVLIEDEHGEAIDRLIRRCAFVLIPLSVLYIKYYPRIGIQYTIHEGTRMWVGVTTQKNSLGLLCAFVGIYLIWRLITYWPKPALLDGLILALTLYLLYGAHSATSYIIFFVGIIILLLLIWFKNDRKKLNRMVIATTFCLIILITFYGEVAANIFFAAAGRDPTFTGRVPLWSELIKRGSQSPIFGTGYGNFWLVNIKEIWAHFSWRPVSGHNGYIDIFLDLGLVGLALLLLLIVQTYRKAIQSISTDVRINGLLFVFLIMILLHNLTESSLPAGGPHFLWLLFLMPAIVVKKRPVSHDDQRSQLREVKVP